MVVAEASNGEDGIEKAEACRPSLIITDLKMPKMDGLEMIAKLRERGCEAYVIILTAYDSFTYAADGHPGWGGGFSLKAVS